MLKKRKERIEKEKLEEEKQKEMPQEKRKTKKKKTKLFALVPLKKKNIPGSIHLDTRSIVLLFSEEFSWIGISQKTMKRNEKFIWNYIFKVPKNNFHFQFYMDTDGVQCGFLFSNKPKPPKRGMKRKRKKKQTFNFDNEEKEKEQLQALETNTGVRVGVDPGKKSILYMVGFLQSGKKKVVKYTNVQRRKECFFLHRTQLIQKKKNKYPMVQEAERVLSNYDSKEPSLHDFLQYVSTVLNIMDTLHNFYENTYFRALKRKTYRYTQNSETKLIKQIEENFGKDCVLGYGSWCASTQLKNLMPSPTSGIKEKLRKNFMLVTVPEWNTTKTCNQCGGKVIKFIFLI
jgi:hypothetical protein